MTQRIIIREERQRLHAIDRIAALNIETVWDISIKPYKKNRSLEQNALMWKWNTIIGDHLGYTKDEMHEEFMRKFLPPVMIDTMSGPVEVYSTKQLKVKEMAEYLNHIERFAAEYAIVLPLPDWE
jgi:hypothetical protein